MTHPRECWGLGGRLARAWKTKQAVRVGEAAVVSRQVHTISPLEPDTVRILTNADAGQVFYKRRNPGEVVHLDLFHQVMAIPPKEIAGRLTSSIRAYQTDWAIISGSNDLPPELAKILDRVDIQTGAGGGRLTGALNFGQRQSLCQAHMNHVHITILLPDRFAVLVFYLVNSLEQYLLGRGIEIRKIRHLISEATLLCSQPGMNDYCAHTDSLLLEYQNQTPYSSLRSSIPGLSINDDQQRLMHAELNPAERCMTIGERFSDAPPPHDRSYVVRNDSLGLREQSCLLPGKEGRILRGKVRRSFVHNLTTSSTLGNQYMGPLALGRASGKVGPEVVDYRRGEPLGEIALIETVLSSLMRRSHQKTPFEVRGSDLRIRKCRTHSPCNICLLIDASASMKGRRLQAATSLAQRLVVGTRDKVAVLTFQESEVRVAVPFTRKIQELSAGLELIKPFGLTPLAAGLGYARDYIRQSMVRNPLLVLISDGIPTVPSATSDPITDAIDEAKALRDANIRFCCIGLEPNRNVLAEVTASASGTLYVVRELDGDALVQIVSRAKETL